MGERRWRRSAHATWRVVRVARWLECLKWRAQRFCRTLRPYRLASVPPRTTDHRNQLHVQEHIMVGLHDAQTWR